MIPKLLSRGCFTLLAPFDSVIDSQQLYTCTAIRTITEMIYSDDQPFESIYEPNNLSVDIYNQHIKDSVLIVTLTGDADENIYVPEPYIKNQPYVNGIVYKNKSVVINLGGLPDSEDVDLLLSRLKDETIAAAGIDTTPELVETSSTYLVSYDDHEALGNIRDNAKDRYGSYRARYLDALSTISELTSQISLLECVLSNNCCGEGCDSAIINPVTIGHVELCINDSDTSRSITASQLFQRSGCYTKTHRSDIPQAGSAPLYIAPSDVVAYEFDVSKHAYVGTADLVFRNNT